MGTTSASDIPVCSDQEEREDLYVAAKQHSWPYLAIEAGEDGYCVVYDLLPTGRELAPGPAERLREEVTAAVESVVADDDRPTAEVSHTLGADMGTLFTFEREESARDVALAVSDVVHDEDNWGDENSL